MSISGGCLCNAVRVRLEPPTAFVSHCHCASCRRAHAAAFVTWTRVADERLQVSGEAGLTHFESSPGVVRSFCSTCGTPLLFRGADMPGWTYLPVAVFDQPLDTTPDSHVSWEEHVPWIDDLDRLPRYRGKTDERM